MQKLCVFFVLAVITSEAMCMSFRQKRQAPQEQGPLEDRYGWDRPSGIWIFPDFPFPNPNEQFPDQGQVPDQGQRPDQGQVPDQGQFPGQGQLPGQGQQTTPPATNNGGPTTMSPAIQQCIRDCRVTSEYNPVCGTDNVTYNNPGRLLCAQACGLNISLLRSAPCPPATTAAPS